MRIRQDRLYVLLWSALVVVAGLALASIAADYQASSERAQRHAQFRHQADLTFNAIHQQVAAGSQLVRSMQASLQVSEDIDQQEFEQIYESLNPKAVFPGLQAMVYSRRSLDAGGQQHYRTTFVAPKEGNARLQALDLVDQPQNMVAVRRSEATGEPAMSEPFALIQDGSLPAGEMPLGMTIRTPVYRPGVEGSERTIDGSFGISFRINDLIAAALPSQATSGIAVQVFDISGPRPQPIYATGKPATNAEPLEEKFEAGGRWWSVRLTPAAQTDVVSLWPLLTFSSIALTSMLVSMLIYNLLSTRARAIRMAGEMTHRFRQSEERFRLLNENLPGLVVLADQEGRISYANRSCRDRMGLNGSQAQHTVMDLFAVPALLERLNALPEGTSQMQMPRIRLLDASGAEFWASLSFTSMDMDGSRHILALGSDVSEIIEMSEQLDFQAKQLHFQATHDQLTGLSNRREMEDRLAVAIAEAGHGIVSGLLYIDLDQFKVINDTAGHMVGDRLLVQAAEGMRNLLVADELLARMGGDEFAVLLRNTSPNHAQNTAERIRKFFEEFSYTWEGVPYQVSCSIGGVMIDASSMTQEDALSRADAACYMAKERGRNRWQFFDQNDESAARRLEMEWVGRIRQAIASKRMRLYYQDIVPITPNAAHGAHFEILVRMEDEDGRLVPAGEFIPAAERYGLMSVIDRWVVETSIRNFDKLHPSGKVAICAINLSGETVDNKEFEDFLIDELTRHPEAASRICIEITETSLIRNMERLQEFIPRLRATGCRLALDDFGAGQSSFGYLKNLHVDIIKIDGSFIRDLDHDAMSNSIVSAVTDIAHKMDMEVVAEWVSSKVILNLLRQMGVNYVQGFYLHKPAPCPIGP